MSKKIPFLQMFAALRRWTELSNAVEGWLILSAAIDKASRSARIVVEGAAGAGPNLIREAEEAVCRAYSLNSVKIETAPAPAPEKAEEKPVPAAPAEEKPAASAGGEDTFARAEAIRRALEHLVAAMEAMAWGVTPDAVLTEAEGAMSAIGELTGRNVRQDVTQQIFARFCVGK